MAGNYAFFFTSAGASYIKVTPKALDATGLSMGSYATGDIMMPEEIDPTIEFALDPAPSQIKAASYSLSAGDAFTYSFSSLEHLTGTLAPSDVTCWYFDSLKWGNGLPISGQLVSGSSTQPTSMAVASAHAYIVLVANVPTRITYSMGLTPIVIPTAPLNTPLALNLPVAGLAHMQLYKFDLAQDSIVRFNRTAVTGTTMSAHVSRITTDQTLYDAYFSDITSGSSWIRQGSAEAAYSYAQYFPAGTYGLTFTSTGTSSTQVEVNAYPLSSYTLGSALNVSRQTTKALNIDISDAFRYTTFNVSLTSLLNASLTYRLTLFDKYGRYLGAINRDGSSAGLAGIGNKLYAGGWQGINPTQQYYVRPSGAQLYFGGNSTLQQLLFVPTYADKYFIVVDVLNCYDTTTSGGSGSANWWRLYNSTLPLNIVTSDPVYGSVASGLDAIMYATLNSTSGSGSTTVTFTSTASSDLIMIGLVLTPKVNTWTRISATIINGTSGGTTNGTRTSGFYEKLFDIVRWGPLGSETNTFNNDNGILPQLWPDDTYYGVSPAVGGHRNAVYIIEFGALQKEMMVRFLTSVYGSGTAAHTVVNINVTHYDTPAFSGLTVPTGALGGAVSPIVILLIVAVIVAVVVVVAFIALRKRKHGST